MISANESRIKEKSAKIADKSINKRYGDDNIDDNKSVEQTRLSPEFFCTFTIYQSLSAIYWRYIADDSRARILRHVES